MAEHLPLNLLTELAQQDLDDAARKLGAQQAQRTEAERQLQALVAYRHEYRNRLQTATQDGMAAAGWRNFQQFIDTLDVAIGRQRDLLVLAEQKVAAAQHDWQQHKQRLNSFETLASRAQAREDVRTARREQKDNDEYAAKLSRSRQTLHDTKERAC
ncbi:flagellar protein FliJ [Pandoraea thiooxydans]|uniref:Flagellar FliJ protein n=1 Tax=Pandoraea thiooxydans TaxID=445709 RepID=A0A0G3ERY0_9BURK|nr:flagellar export protein FliJ [Pandoraea thiooxydans]AKJ69725.1 flagellar export protein FliJ [Pandoraea thiooxydans]APR97464.1 flagellar protein FliJ [Pandoraea thiooxydans]